MIRLLLIRHGHTLGVKNTYYGWQDIQLSPEGLAQSEMITEKLRDIEIAAVFSSDLSRARILGEMIAAEKNLPLNIDRRIRELNFGDWEGKTSSELFENEQFQKWINNITEEEIPHGESIQDLAKRTNGFFTMLVKKYQNCTIAVVSHYGALKSLLLNILKMEQSSFWNFHLDLASLTIIDYHDQKPKIDTLNELCHLGGIHAHLN